MRLITERDISNSYDTLALLNVCSAAASYLESQPRSDNSIALCGSLSAVIRHTQKLAIATHDLLESIESESAS